ncbi:MAG TPA: FliH/SctL family protein [Syntrophales bacterium]|nr:FliH/SctL family protein [Syntrophales bacterium]
MSDKIIKAKDVVQVAKPLLPSLGFVRSQPTGNNGNLSLQQEAGLAELNEEKKATEEVRKEAYKQGFSEGLQFRKNETLQAMKALTGLINEVGALKKKFYEEAEGQMLELIFSIVEKVIHREVATNKDVVLSVLKEAVKNVVDRDGMKIRMNPRDFSFMTEIKADFIREMNGAKDVVFEEDAAIMQGGAVLETLSGEVDARLEQQLKEIKTALNVK